MILDEAIEQANEIFDRAVEQHEPSHKLALFSGGDDSLVSTHFMMEFGGADTVIHLDTGIGIPETRQYVRDVCEEFGWDLKIYRAEDYVRGDGEPDPQIYEELVKDQGFPGPAMHWKMYQRLKERPLRMVVRDHKTEWKDRVLLGTGRYRAESERRMQLEDEEIDRDGAWLWVNPMFYWKPELFVEYRERHDLPRNPVSEKVCMSGECLCGAFARPGELLEIAAFYPEVAERIAELEQEVYGEGFDWGWEERPEDAEDREEPPDNMSKLRLCAGCIGKKQNEEAE